MSIIGAGGSRFPSSIIVLPFGLHSSLIESLIEPFGIYFTSSPVSVGVGVGFDVGLGVSLVLILFISFLFLFFVLSSKTLSYI